MTDTLKQAKALAAKLARAGHTAYFAGGWVRDYVMGHPSEDIDIATSASPAEIMDLFPKTLLVGLAFGVVIVVVEGHQFEVATFRKDRPYRDGRHPEGIEAATPWEDAQRRDFTINGLFYDPLEGVIHDFVRGCEDIRLGVVRAIGNPHERFFEDRLRMLRAFRFAARFGFAIEEETQEAIREHAYKLFPAVAWERIWQEFNKMAGYPRFGEALVEMHRLSLLAVIFPEIEGLHLRELREAVSRFAHFSPRTPPLLYLAFLLKELPLERRVEIAKRLTVPNREIKRLAFVDRMQHALEREAEGQPDLVLWTELFSDPDWELYLQICLASRGDAERERLWSLYSRRFERLEAHVDRLKNGKPLVSAALLQQKGVLPGKQMGVLLKAAQRIAIEEDWYEPDPVLNRLESLYSWERPHDEA